MQQGADEPAAGESGCALTARDLAILDFERDFNAHVGGKLVAITERFDITPARYYQLLARLIDSDAAARVDPLLIRRLRRRRSARERTDAQLGPPVRADGTRGTGQRSE